MRTSHRSRPTTSPAVSPNSVVAVSDQETTRPARSSVKAASPARSGSRRRGSPASLSWAVCDSTGILRNHVGEP
ncbi:MAG: hypothetical protein ACRDNF_27170, partial [Streptosporangiaceae bacterium]